MKRKGQKLFKTIFVKFIYFNMNIILMTTEEKLSTLSGISKRLFMALSDLRANPLQLEDALFQLTSVIDSTSKGHFPGEQSSKRRFSNYLESVMTDIYLIATSGKITMTDCTFQINRKYPQTFGDIIYGIRCSSYHDPNEVDDLIHWGGNNQLGTKDGKFLINENLLISLFLILISDEKNKEYIDLDLFDETNTFNVGDIKYPYSRFIGNRDEIFTVLGISKKSSS